MADQKLSQRAVTSLISGGYFYIIIPNGGGGWLSFQIQTSTILDLFLLKTTYDPQNIAQDAFNSLYEVYSNLVSGLSATDVQNAIDELASEVDTINNNLFTIQRDTYTYAGGATPQFIPYTTDFETTDYTLTFNVYDTDGYSTPYRLISESSTGFTIQVDISCTIKWLAILN